MFNVRGLVLPVLLASATVATFAIDTSQIRLPRLPRGIPKEIPRLDRLPSIDDLISRQPLTSSLDDAVTDVGFLDTFNPESGAPLLELPFGLDDGVTLVPGLWEGMLQSYCLKAGTLGPTRGDGYLWAPLKGPKADVVSAILSRSPFHPELPQRDIQVLLWGIIARTKVSNLDPGPRRVAETLLSESQIASIDTTALDIIPDDWLQKIVGPLQGPLRRVLQAENRLRQAFASPSAVAYEELERIAVLNGVPLPDDQREVPGGRWSWHPSGHFIRFLPNSYSNMRLQIYVPERFVSERDARGRLTLIGDMAGRKLQIDYGAEGAAVATGTFSEPGKGPRTIEIRMDGDQSIGRDATQQVARLAGRNQQQSPRARDVADVAQLVAAMQGQDEAAGAMLQRAWASAAGDWLIGGSDAPVAAMEFARHQSASAGGLFARPVETSVMLQRGGGWGGGGGGGSGGGGAGGGGMPGGGRQRLGPSLKKFGDDNSIDRARNAIDKFGTAKNVLDAGTDPAGLLGMGIPDALFGRILDFNFDTWFAASSALAGDPPRPDFREFTKPDVLNVPQLEAGPGLTAAQADLLNALARDLTAVNAHLRAAIVALDRHGGAVQAKERAWASRQAHALTYLKREAGVLSLKVAAHLDALAAEARDRPAFTADQIAASRKRMQDGWTEIDRKAASLAGLTDADLDKLRAARLALNDAALEVRPADALTDAAEGMRELGGHFAALPAIGAPWDSRD
jgi:hypothetical protein